MEPDEPWERSFSSSSLIFGDWFVKYVMVPHRSIESKTIIWPGMKAMRRTLYYHKGHREHQWITVKELIYLRLQGKT